MERKMILAMIIRLIKMEEEEFRGYGEPFTTTFTGIKRLYYGLWNDGCNERGEDMTLQMNGRVRVDYEKLMNHCKDHYKMGIVKLIQK